MGSDSYLKCEVPHSGAACHNALGGGERGEGEEIIYAMSRASTIEQRGMDMVCRHMI